MAASYPTAPAIFPSRSDGQTIFAAHLNALQDEIAALEASLVGGSLPTPQRITGNAFPTLQFEIPGQLAKGALQFYARQMLLGFNCAFNGAGSVPDDASLPFSQLNVAGDTTIFATAPAGGALAEVFKVMPNGAMRERGRTVAIGDWTSMGFSPTYFIASAGTWTMAAGACVYYFTQIGSMMHVSACLGPSTTTAPNAWIRLALPVAATVAVETSYIINYGTWQAAYASCPAAGFVNLYPTITTGGTIPATTALYVMLNMTFLI